MSRLGWLARKKYQFEAVTSLTMLEPSEKRVLCILRLQICKCLFTVASCSLTQLSARCGDVSTATHDHVHADSVSPTTPETTGHLCHWLLVQPCIHHN